MSQDLTIGDLAEILKFKMNCKIENHLDKISRKDKVILKNKSNKYKAVLISFITWENQI